MDETFFIESEEDPRLSAENFASIWDKLEKFENEKEMAQILVRILEKIDKITFFLNLLESHLVERIGNCGKCTRKRRRRY